LICGLLSSITGEHAAEGGGPWDKHQYVLLYGLKTLFGIESIDALPRWLCNDEAPQQVRQGIGQRGATTRQGERAPGPICPDTLAKHLVDGTDLETTAGDRGCGQVTRKRRVEDKWGRVHEIAVTVYGRNVRLLIEAATKIPFAVKVVHIQEHEALWTRALVIQAWANLAG
jgi:hypothetical protein